MLKTKTKIAVIAGGGYLPEVVINALKKNQDDFIVIALQDNASEVVISGTNHYWFGITEIKKILSVLKENNIKQITFAGCVSRPSLLSMPLDSVTISFLAKIGMKKLKGGADDLLSMVVELCESKGLKVVGAESIAPDLLAPMGILGKHKPSKMDMVDIECGKKVLGALGDLDVGQSVITENDCVLGIEAMEGTDGLIKRCKALKKEEKRLGVLVKMKKGKQDKRVDLPAIGEVTIQNIYDSNLKGIAVEAGSTLIIDLKNVINKADKLGIFLIGI